MITEIRKVVWSIKENNNAMLTAFNNQSNAERACLVLLSINSNFPNVAAKKKNEALNEEVKSLSRQVHMQFKSMFY